jgi:ADP-L-glycero-D-manno-heptose 6-epimerase
MLEDNRPSGIYDLGTGVPVLFSSVAEMIARKFNAKLEIIPFPKHLQDKYQYYTRATETDDKCISVFEYIKTKLQ